MRQTDLSQGSRWLVYDEALKSRHSYEPTREAAMAAFAKSWRRS
jgi:hypothetical protein